MCVFFFFQAEDGIRDGRVTGVQTCALPIFIERRAQARQQSLAQVESGPGVLFASGLMAGGAICGIVLAAVAGVLGSADALAERVPLFHALGALPASNALAFGLFAALGALLYRVGMRKE